MSRLSRITADASVCHGKPVARGLRYQVQMLLELLASGMSVDEVLDVLTITPIWSGTIYLRRWSLGALAARPYGESRCRYKGNATG